MSAPVLPQVLDAERDLLGSVILDNEAISVLLDVPAEAFYAEKHRVIRNAMQDLELRGEPTDLGVLTAYLVSTNQIDRAGGIAYLTGIMNDVTVSAYADSHARMVLEAHRQREIVRIAGRAMQAAYDRQPSEEILQQHEAELTDLTRHDGVERGPDDYVQGALDLVDGKGGLSTGLIDLDAATGGLAAGGLNIIAARPSMGKSSLMRSILAHRVKEGDRVVLFSVDQSGDEIYALTAAARASVNIEHLRKDRHGNRRAPAHKVALFREKLLELRQEWADRLIIYDSHSELHKIQQIAAREIRAGANIIAVDHMQTVSHNGATDETNIVSQVARAFKALVRQHNITLLLLSQLSRSVEARPNKRPVKSDLRQSGAIEEEANQILMLYRDDYYAEEEGRPSDAPGVLEVIVTKNKLGPAPRTAKLAWVSQYARVSNAARPHHQEQLQ